MIKTVALPHVASAQELELELAGGEVKDAPNSLL